MTKKDSGNSTVRITKKKGLTALKQRRQKAPQPVDNAAQPPGSRCYFYCVCCGSLIAELKENFVDPPPKLCADCKILEDKGWLDKDDKQFAAHYP